MTYLFLDKSFFKKIILVIDLQQAVEQPSKLWFKKKCPGVEYLQQGAMDWGELDILLDWFLKDREVAWGD